MVNVWMDGDKVFTLREALAGQRRAQKKPLPRVAKPDRGSKQLSVRRAIRRVSLAAALRGEGRAWAEVLALFLRGCKQPNLSSAIAAAYAAVVIAGAKVGVKRE